MSKPIHTDRFPGMNNVEDDSLVRAVLNMDVLPGGDEKNPGGELEIRKGYALWQALAGAHSLFSNGAEFYCAAGTSLKKVSPGKVITTLATIAGVDDPLFFIQVGARLFMSSRSWNGIYDLGVVRQWGAEYSDDPEHYSDASTSEEFIQQGNTVAPFMENLALAGGRIFGTVGSKLHYSDPPLAYEMYRRDTFLEFTADLVMVAVSNAGLYMASADTTWFAQGFDPENFQQTVVGGGVIPGTLQYLESYKGVNNVPIWLDKDGVQAGIQGAVMPLTKNRVRIDHTDARAASHYNAKDGRFMASMIAPPDAAFGDIVTCEVVRNGKLIT
jgi:hypothetical protein